MHQKITALTVIIVAAGRAQRMGKGKNKVFLPIGDREMLVHTLLSWQNSDLVRNIIIVTAAGEEASCRFLVEKWRVDKVKAIVAGGDSRQQSVMAAIPYLDADCQVVAVHDAARPFFDPQDLPVLLSALQTGDGVIPAVPVKDTVKQALEDKVQKTLSRDALWAAQTPQIFWRDSWQKAYVKAAVAGFTATDDASLVEWAGGNVLLRPGRTENIKITEPLDLLWAQFWYQEKTGQGEKKMRSGIGYDAHRLVAGRPLILGGVAIPYDKGLLGHSDADVLAHAVMDALLGAASLGDIGKHFPDTEEAYRGCSSLWLLHETCTLLQKAGFRPVHIDATVIAEAPKLAPYIADMQKKIAEVMQLPPQEVNIKATTTEGLGFTGRGEGIAAMAVANVLLF